MPQVGSTRYVYFRIQGGGGPVTGLTLASFTKVFLRNSAPCVDPLGITDLGGGLYAASYVPSQPGTDYLDLLEPSTNLRATFTAEIDPKPSLVLLNQSTTGLPSGVANPQLYTLSFYLSTDWTNGNRTAPYEKGQTGLNPDGSWKTQFSLPSGMYTAVLWNGNTTIVLTQNYLV